MKLTAISIQKWNGADKEATSLGLAADVSSYGYFQRAAVTQMMAFVARTVAQRTQPGQRQSVQQVVILPMIVIFLASSFANVLHVSQMRCFRLLSSPHAGAGNHHMIAS